MEHGFNGVTIRKPTTNMNKSDELPSLDNTFNENSYQSLPDITTTYEIQELKEKVEKLNRDLNIATSEIDNLNLENSSLTKKLKVYENKIKLYKSVGIGIDDYNKSCTSPTLRFYSPQYQKKYISASHIKTSGNNSTQTYLQDSVAHPRATRADYQILKTKSVDGLATLIEAENVSTPIVKKKSSQSQVRLINFNRGDVDQSTIDGASCRTSKVKHRLLILADQAGYGIREKIQKLLGDNFFVTCYLKPNAEIDQILRYSEHLCKDFTKSDFVLILGGTNDSNLIKLQSFLYYMLHKIRHTNILIGEILRNKYFNVRKLNSLVKLICTYFNHSRYIVLNDEFQYGYINKLNVCRLLLRDILNVNYKNNYVNYITQVRRKSLVNCHKTLRRLLTANNTQTLESTLTSNTLSNSLVKKNTSYVDVSTQTDDFLENDFFRDK